jgi:esterase/lipase superfamily enzyme
MAKIEVFFATNRNRLPDKNGMADFGDLASPSVKGIAFGVAAVDNVNLDHPDAGQITEVDVLDFGGIGPQLAAKILADPGRDILVFAHGAANTFADALRRAAFNRSWIDQAPGRGTTVIVLSWPATSYRLWNLAADLRDYRHDQS